MNFNAWTATLPTVIFVISFRSFQLVQACGTLRDGEPSSTTLDEVNQNRRVTVDDNTGSSIANLGTLVRIAQAQSAFLFPSPPFHTNGWWCRSQWLNGNRTSSQSAFSHPPSGVRGNHQAGAHAAILGLSSEDRVQRQSGHRDRGWG